MILATLLIPAGVYGASAASSPVPTGPKAKVYRPKAPLALGMIGLGKMGGNMTARIIKGGHRVIAFDPDAGARERAAEVGGEPVESLEAMISRMPAGKRILWTMLPAGRITQETLERLAPMLDKGDVIIEGGNSHYKDTVRRAAALAERGIELVDVGTSGGIKGLERGYSLMVGGNARTVKGLSPIFQTLAPGRNLGWGRVGPSGAGHRAKMIHNGIEYAMMAALAEGLDLAATGPLGMKPDLLTRVWQKGSIVSSLLVDITADGLKANPTLAGLGHVVPDSGEGRWTVMDSVEHGVDTAVMTTAMMKRFASQRQETEIANPIQQVMRAGFGGHVATKAKGASETPR